MEIRSLCLSPKYIGNKVAEGFKKTKEKIKDKSFFKLDRKKIAIFSSILLIGAAIYLNYIFFIDDGNMLNGDNNSVNAPIDSENNDDTNTTLNYFAQAVIDRQKARDEALEVLKIVVDNEDALAESKDHAIQQMSQIAGDMQKESNIESLIVSKGFEQCVAVISDGKCNVIVKSNGLLANQISQIKEIVYEQAAIAPINVKIIEKN